MRRISLVLFALLLLSLVPAAASAVPAIVMDGGPSRALAAPGDSIPYVIVTTKALRPEFMRLAQRHTHDGLRAEIVTLESIRAAYPVAADDAQRVRFFLQDAHRDWRLGWALLGGNVSVVPSDG